MPPKEDYFITIKGTMEQGHDTDSVELVTRGSFTHREGSYYITYKESAATGYEGCTTTVKIADDARRVAMLRFGPAPSQLIIEKGVRHLCHYETPYGCMNLGVAADTIRHALSEEGGEADFSYTLDSGSEDLFSRNLVHLIVKKNKD